MRTTVDQETGDRRSGPHGPRPSAMYVPVLAMVDVDADVDAVSVGLISRPFYRDRGNSGPASPARMFA